MSQNLAHRITISQIALTTDPINISQEKPDLGVQLKALKTNSGVIYVGHSDAKDDNSYQLDPGESVFIPVDTIKNVFASAQIDNDRLSVIIL